MSDRGIQMTKHLLIFNNGGRVEYFIRLLAEQTRYRATNAVTIEAFRELFDESRPEEIVLDIQNGSDDGIKVLRFLAGECFIGRITLLSDTDGWALESARQFGESLGLTVGQVLHKPVKAGALRAALERHDEPTVPITGAELAAAIDNELLLEYQPIVSCTPGTLIDIEALVRWERPGLGVVPPEYFMPLAEADPELMDRVALAVAARAARDWPALKLAGFCGRIAINLSAQNVRRADFPERLAGLLMDRGLPPAHVKLEVTESAALIDPAGALGNLQRLRRNGFSLSIDDFGTRYSSLAMLGQQPYSELKIDGCFITDMHKSRDALDVVRAIVALAQCKKMNTVAEGVEDEEVLPFLGRLGVTYAQGYGICRPLLLSHLLDWISFRKAGLSQSARVASKLL